MKDNALRRLFAMIIALAMLTTPIMAVAEEAAEASEPVIEAEGLEPMVEETEAVVLGGEEEVAVEAEAENTAEEVAAPVEAEKTYADEDYPSEDRELVVTKNTAKVTVNMGDTLDVTLDMDGVYASGTWKSNKTKVAVVEDTENEDGNTITALSPGTAKITVKLSNKKTLTITVTVADPYIATDVDFDESAGSAQMRVGDELDLADFIIMEPEWADPSTLTWKSSKSSVAKVDKYGHVTAKKAGTAKITVTTKKTKKKDTIEIQVVTNKLTNMFPKPTKAVVSAMAEGGWTFVPASMEMKSNGNLDCQFYLLNGTSLKTKELHNLNIYLAGEDGEPFAYNNFGTVKAAASKNGYKAFKLSFPSAKVDHEVFLPELGDIFIGFEDVDTVYAIANDKYKSELDFIPLDDWHITDSYVPEPQPQPQNVKVTSITLAPPSASLEVGGTTTLTATVSPTNATNKSVTWKSSDTSVATVANGVVTAKAVGTTTITATAADGSNVEGVCSVTVKAAAPAAVKVTKITLDKTTVSLEEGKTEKLTATVEPSNATDSKVTWTTSNSAVATVSDGTITAVKAGTATITATAADGSGIKAECAVTVTVPKNITLDKENVDLIINKSIKLNATVKNGQSVVWSTPNTDIVTVDKDKGIVTAKTELGKAEVIATAGSDSATCIINVVGLDSKSFTLSPDADKENLQKGKSYKVNVTSITPADANYNSITWTSSNENAVKVTLDESGKVATITAVKGGEAEIKAVAKEVPEGQEKPFEIKFKVTVPVIAKTIMLSETSMSLEANSSKVLSVTNILAEDTTETVSNKSVTYTSSNTAIATVDSTGKVTGKAIGSAIIYVESADGGAKTSCTVTVTEPEVTKIEFDDASYTTAIDARNPLDLSKNIKFTPANAADKSVTWSSSNQSVATVDANGVVTGKSKGTAYITVKSKANTSITATCSVNVVVGVSGVTIAKNKNTDPDFIDISSDSTTKTLTLKATVEPANAALDELIWSTSDKTIATFDGGAETATGSSVSVEGKKEGQATITVKVKEDAKQKEADMIKATFVVTVKDIVHVENITLTSVKKDISVTNGKADDMIELWMGESEVLSASVSSKNSTTPTETGVTWKSLNPGIATVSNGLVIPVKAGKTTITVESKDTNKKSASVDVEVKQHVTGLTLDKTGTFTLKVGEKLELKPTVAPSDAKDKSLVYNFEKAGIASIEEKGGVYTVTAVSVGETKLTFTSNDNNETEASVTIKVVAVPLEKVTGVSISLDGSKNIQVTWNNEGSGKADHYWVICKQGTTETYKVQVEGLNTTTAMIPANKLKDGNDYQITVQATLGEDEAQPTSGTDYMEGPVSDAVTVNY